MKKHQVIAALALAVIAAPASSASARRVTPIGTPPRPPNPNHFRTLDITHAVVTTLTVPPLSTSIPLNCWYGLCQAPLEAGDFSADFGSGSDISSAWGFVWDLEGRVTEVGFDRVPNAIFEHLTGFYENAPSSVVDGFMQIDMGNSGAFPAGALVLALQTQNPAGAWADVTTTPSPVMDNTKGSEAAFSLYVSAYVPSRTAVRLELRASAVAAAGTFVAYYGALHTPECAPDPANDGGCLP